MPGAKLLSSENIKLPPHSIEAEQAVLGGLLLSGMLLGGQLLGY